MKFQKFKVIFFFFYILFRILPAWLIHLPCGLGQSNCQVPFLLNGSNNITNLRIHMRFKKNVGNSLVVQWLGVHTIIAKDPGSIPGHGTKISQALQGDQKKKKR